LGLFAASTTQNEKFHCKILTMRRIQGYLKKVIAFFVYKKQLSGLVSCKSNGA